MLMTSMADRERSEGQYLWKNVYYELERLNIALLTINLFQKG